MVRDIKVRKVAQDVLLFVCFKKEIIKEETSLDLRFTPEITTELNKNLSIAVWMEVCRNEIIWEDFFRNHFKRMVSSTYRFVHYVAYVFYVFIEQLDAYDSFLDTLAIMTNIALLCWEKESKVYVNMCVDLFCEFFETEVQAKFEGKGGWHNLEDYLLKHTSLTKYETLVSENASPFEYYQSLKSELGQNNVLVYQVNEVLVSAATRRQVESHKKTINFTKSVGDKMKRLRKLTFDEMCQEFAKTDRQLEELYQIQVGTASEGMASIKGQSLLQNIQDDASKNIPSKIQRDKKELETQIITASDPIETQNSCSVGFQDVTEPTQSLDVGVKSRKSERVKELLDDLSASISNLKIFIHSLCEDHEVHKLDY